MTILSHVTVHISREDSEAFWLGHGEVWTGQRGNGRTTGQYCITPLVPLSDIQIHTERLRPRPREYLELLQGPGNDRLAGRLLLAQRQQPLDRLLESLPLDEQVSRLHDHQQEVIHLRGKQAQADNRPRSCFLFSFNPIGTQWHLRVPGPAAIC